MYCDSFFIVLFFPDSGFQRVTNPNCICEVADPGSLWCFPETTQIEDPRVQWRREQEHMLKDYLVVAQEALSAQKEIYQVKQQRLELAQQEYQQLHAVWEHKLGSQVSCEYLPLPAPPTSATAGSREWPAVESCLHRLRAQICLCSSVSSPLCCSAYSCGCLAVIHLPFPLHSLSFICNPLSMSVRLRVSPCLNPSVAGEVPSRELLF